MSGQQPGTTRPPGRMHTIVGAVFGVMAILFFPIVFGPLGAILGFAGHRKGDKPLGTYVGAGSIMTTIIGITLGAIASSVS